jgi:ribosomal protein S18 acetylase RimI-like enzyme
MQTKVLQEDSWLSGYFSYPVYHLSGFDLSLKKEALPSGKVFVDVKAGVGEIEKISLLESLGFRLIDTNVQLTRKAGPFDIITTRCRFAEPSDENAVRLIARHSFSQSRFHLDPAVTDEVANEIKSDWAGNFFLGKRGDWLVVAEQDGEISGFLQLLKKDNDTIVIDLIAVKKDKQGLGLGSEMIAFASCACLQKEAAMEVGTQIANHSSLRLYNQLGFQISGAKYVLHLHQYNNGE